MASLSPYPARFYHLQMASLSPFPQLCFDECKFLGTLVSNHLLPSSRKRQNCQSNSSGSSRLNRGNCCTPKFSLPFSQEITTSGFSLIFQIGSRIGRTNFSLSSKSRIRVSTDFVEIGSGIDQTDFSLTTSPELGFPLIGLRLAQELIKQTFL